MLRCEDFEEDVPYDEFTVEVPVAAFNSHLQAIATTFVEDVFINNTVGGKTVAFGNCIFQLRVRCQT